MTEYAMSCDDGFMIKSKDKDEVAHLAGMHMMMMHPAEHVSGKDMFERVKKVEKLSEKKLYRKVAE